MGRSTARSFFHLFKSKERLDKQPDTWAAYYALGLSKVAIARAEKMDESTVRKSMEQGLKQFAKMLKR